MWFREGEKDKDRKGLENISREKEKKEKLVEEDKALQKFGTSCVIKILFLVILDESSNSSQTG